MKILTRSEYSTVEQFKANSYPDIHCPLTSSVAHTNALLKVLNEFHVPNNTNSQELESIVEQVLVTNIITFIEDELRKWNGL